ncbi:unnamed protein product [Cylicocyclus nassatus]|uniref:Uncharacterized protein n=1 Tax=Cylicocyclus nassatus TaxID=53992 RepID=A0AA36GS85_CYLNA|nr:unnamed protein product [Cylicocyclus nassatus]
MNIYNHYVRHTVTPLHLQAKVQLPLDPYLEVPERLDRKLEADLARATVDLEIVRREIEELSAERLPPCSKCAELQKNYKECQVHFRILVAKNMRETEAAETARIVERRRNMNLNKEVLELNEDLHNVRRLFLYSEELVRQLQTLLEEALYEEEIYYLL